ncbi:unnamed protein product [Camellia sinensis]
MHSDSENYREIQMLRSIGEKEQKSRFPSHPSPQYDQTCYVRWMCRMISRPRKPKGNILLKEFLVGSIVIYGVKSGKNNFIF